MDSLLITVPVSSPLHPQAILPCLQAFLEKYGFSVKSVDTNIKFFRDVLGEEYDISALKKFSKDPIRVLKFYNDLENALTLRSSAYRNCKIGLRSLKLDHNRTDFGEVKKALYDKEANPFIEFYDKFITEEVMGASPKIAAISITFQDQIVPAFTLARLLRERMPHLKIVMGGQIITRCHDTLPDSEELKNYWDYLVLWEGELPILDIHEAVINGKKVEFVNVLENSNPARRIDRSLKTVPMEDLPAPDFSDIEFDKYLFSDLLIPLQTSRSCYARCKFCAIPFGANLRFRQKTHRQVLDDIIKIKESIGKRYNRDAVYFKFMDDTTSPRLLYDLAREIESSKLNVRWDTFARLDKEYADDNFMAQLYRGGCRKLCWGLESSDPDILKKMNKKNTNAQSTRILNASAKAGILNFCFILLGFPGETQEQRDSMADYIINNADIHVLTIATFDFTKFSPLYEEYTYPNEYGIYCGDPSGFEVRLPYVIDGRADWKEMVVNEAHKMLLKIINHRPDIGFMSLFPDQIRMEYCDRYGNGWGRDFVKKYGEKDVKTLLTQTQKYVEASREGKKIDVSNLPEPLQREYYREQEDLLAIRHAIARREEYNKRRREQV